MPEQGMPKMDGFTEIRDETPHVGVMNFATPRGEILANEVPGLLTMSMDTPDHKPLHVAMLLYDPSTRLGMWIQMTPQAARQAASSLIHLANRADPLGGAN